MAKLRAGLEVSCLALTFFYDYLKGHGIPRSRIQEGLPYSPEYLEEVADPGPRRIHQHLRADRASAVGTVQLHSPVLRVPIGSDASRLNKDRRTALRGIQRVQYH